MWQVGVDTGGTFTDVVAINELGERRVAKVPSTPPDFHVGILDGLLRLSLSPEEIGLICHGTTVTTNAAITKTGANAALIATKGFRDLLEIRRGHRQDLYDIMWDPPPPLIPRYNRLEIDERTDYSGKIMKEVDEEELATLVRILKKRNIESVAICFLHSFANPHNEKVVLERIAEALPGCFVTASSEILPQPPEFQRTSTVAANAYLGPVLTNYLGGLIKSLRDNGFSADVLIMHSGGGVMTIESANRLPVRTAGSGPAAGVIGAAAIGREAKRRNLISLDMGGTSTDVSVIFEGQPRVSTEHNLEWGLPVRFPSIDFIAIGAGGGSIAWVDPAGYPRVGPQSAGAVPGPACFGRGGTLPTTTDANLILGRLGEGTFLDGELNVDAAAADKAIKDAVGAELGLTSEEAASGIIRIINASMASAVRLMTVQKGFDPREFTLVAFGGAGPLHAIEVARELSIPEVIVPPQPGLTSALGLMFVDLVHDLSQGFVLSAGTDRLSEAEEILVRFEEELLGRLHSEGAQDEDIDLRRFLDMRYVGQVHTIRVPIPRADFTEALFNDAIAYFHAEHEREYRYSRAEWAVEVAVLRVEGRGQRVKPNLLVQLEGSTPPEPSFRRQVYLDGLGWTDTPVYARQDLAESVMIDGPAVIEEYDSTTFLPQGSSAKVDRLGNLIIDPGVAIPSVGEVVQPSDSVQINSIDPVTFEVLRNAFIAAVDEMGVMLEKAAFSLVVSEGRDFSTSFCDADGNLVADGTQDLPGHVGTIPFTTQGILELIGRDRIRPGDVLIMNDPFIGGTHCQDVRTVMPVFLDGELAAFVQASAHWVDAGGPVAGSFKVDALESYGEALYITPIHLVREGEVDEDVLRLIMRNVRVPQITRGDVAAMVEACRTGEARIQALNEKYGRQLLLTQMSELIKHSRRLLSAHISSLPNGSYEFTDFIDYDPGADSREPLPVHLKLTIDGDHAIFDFSESSPQAKGAINATRSLLWSAVVVATKAIFPDVPVNQGVFKAVEVVAPDGLIVTARFPAAVSGAFATCYEKITGCVLGCFMQIVPERAMVGSGNVSNVCIGGFDPRPGFEADYVMYNWMQGGWGARPGKRDNHTAMSLFASGTQNQPLETTEFAYPAIFTSYSLIQDSAGPGRHRGGLGLDRNFYLSHGGGMLTSIGDREEIPAWGFGGGLQAKGNGLIYKPGQPDEVAIGQKKTGFPIEEGAPLQYWQGGGGGFGPPHERPVEWVLEDVINEYVSIESARRDYAVEISVIDAEALQYEIDERATKELRTKAAAEWGA